MIDNDKLAELATWAKLGNDLAKAGMPCTIAHPETIGEVVAELQRFRAVRSEITSLKHIPMYVLKSVLSILDRAQNGDVKP